MYNGVNFKRLKKNHDFLKVYRKGKSLAQHYIVMYYIANGLKFNRIGFSISKKVGNSVVRNRIRRLIFESFLLQQDKIEQGYDFVFIARKKASVAGFKEVSNNIERLLEKVGLKNKH